MTRNSQTAYWLQRYIQDPAEYLRWSFFQKKLTVESRLTISVKSSILGFRLGS